MFKIKNWEEFQPPLRADRNVIWIKLYRKILDDFNWSNLKAKTVTYTTVKFDSYEGIKYFKWHVEKVKKGNFKENK